MFWTLLDFGEKWQEIAKDYPDVTLEFCFVDNAANVNDS